MLNDEICKLRDKLNESIISGEDYSIIYKLSVELDELIAKYYQDKIWQEFIWTISWTIPAWFFVVLENTSEWLVNIEEFCKQNKIKRCEYNEQAMKFEVSKDLFLQVWDVVKIKIREVELEKRRLNFYFLQKIIK